MVKHIQHAHVPLHFEVLFHFDRLEELDVPNICPRVSCIVARHVTEWGIEYGICRWRVRDEPHVLIRHYFRRIGRVREDRVSGRIGWIHECPNQPVVGPIKAY